MLSSHKSDERTSKAFVSSGILPAIVDPQQVPSTKKPFSIISNQPFTHTVELVLPEELYDLVWQDVSSRIGNLEYSRVIMSLSELVDGDFFNMYIKSGNILMLSEGRPGNDNQYMLKDGQLRLDLAKETYERTGLLGKQIRDFGREHVKTRYSIEIDLRQPSMLHGKKGFERIVWAFKNVLNRSVTWLFHDFEEHKDRTLRPISKHHPINYTVTAQHRTTEATLTPSIDLTKATSSDGDFEDWVLDICEWLSLISLQSPRVQASDSIDPYLSRYHIPTSDSELQSQCNMIRLSWKALVPTPWVQNLFISLNDICSRATAMKPRTFFALSSHAFHTEVDSQRDGYTILWLSDTSVAEISTSDLDVSKKQKHAGRRGREFVVWELRSK